MTNSNPTLAGVAGHDLIDELVRRLGANEAARQLGVPSIYELRDMLD